ncbi:maleylpyruvate isomerase N-terminal domain-containing protein [Nocardioides sp. GCM10028917]|uniref:maleylpyruvate isomerase N-terminal domain-containing protein n=1 Tax=Nocardioides sp. GCM10028917 TaxID=3273408 RepID=UPI00360720CE
MDGADTPEDFAPSVWDEWNSKAPAQQRRDALSADAQLSEALEAVSGQDRERVTFAMGPMTLTFADFVAMRLNEHAFHTWDIEVVHDPAAVLPPTSAEVVADHLELVARFTAQPAGEQRTVRVNTTQPVRSFVIELEPEAAAFRPVDAHDGPVDLELPAEALARLVYGRLDAAHTPPTVSDANSRDALRHVFPGP